MIHLLPMNLMQNNHSGNQQQNDSINNQASNQPSILRQILLKSLIIHIDQHMNKSQNRRKSLHKHNNLRKANNGTHWRLLSDCWNQGHKGDEQQDYVSHYVVDVGYVLVEDCHVYYAQEEEREVDGEDGGPGFFVHW